ncbi:bifunctional phosphopantothenoylcysteine decarboxylase/phosphopantothenate--cysteine ligase CoaBC [Actinomadura parmotrematis]|uniref:Coenzyme A biosynthesis bifunctional protein CoaBC n=1 Tax=Actinomadura parmotrematis TaxID=2864039 RepID=A0ABS7FMD2_9ACTN|nr:bifunctional phosphopantothenoylcysteine decarboxylase/phosphopantothenate--cysteine ligase CoaBC [Actinomadura parmotrematis]MBW8480924.1 bifunctional phosphopantothenoylcysteine decarboxylase/phosphopantothenate--cysteine ligase CoaBC [Actinomadura parmotrematis]
MSTSTGTTGPRVVLGVSGGIAAYKACELLRRLTESGHDVRVVPTAEALRFVGEPTWAALSGHPVRTAVFEDVAEVPHVRLGQDADLVLVAPATANTLAKAAAGLADDLLTNTLLTARCPVVFAPAMHTEMWEHPATRANVATLRARGALVVEPASGRLTGADTGKGRLPDPAELFEVARRVLARGDLPRDLAGRRVVVSAGGTREALDPVRFLGNRSSGLQGYALARTAAARGARVTLVAANVALPDPAGIGVVAVESAEDMRKAVLEAAQGPGGAADAVVMAAAVADFRPAGYRNSKIKKEPGAGPAPIALVQNPDILAELAARPRGGQVVVGFAAETDDVLANGRAKLARKGCDLLVVNRVGADLTFGRPDNEAVILAADGAAPTEVPRGAKEALADVVWDLVAARLAPPGGSCPEGARGPAAP